MKPKRNDWMMFLLVLPFALFASIILWIGAKDIEAHKAQQFVEDSVTLIEDDTTYKISGSRLMTLEDSIHYFEDGF